MFDPSLHPDYSPVLTEDSIFTKAGVILESAYEAAAKLSLQKEEPVDRLLIAVLITDTRAAVSNYCDPVCPPEAKGNTPLEIYQGMLKVIGGVGEDDIDTDMDAIQSLCASVGMLRLAIDKAEGEHLEALQANASAIAGAIMQCFPTAKTLGLHMSPVIGKDGEVEGIEIKEIVQITSIGEKVA